MSFRPLRLALTILAIFMATASLAHAGWSDVRDKAMTLRERGSVTEAYRTVVGANPSGARDIVDQQFLAGYLALRFLNRADIALEHFKEMAGRVNGLNRGEQSNARSQAGYWLGRTLHAMNNPDEGNKMYAAAAAYRDTFYGQLSASKIGATNSADVLAAYRPNYPDMDIFWHDPRIRRELVLAIIRSESSFRQGAVSPAGAKGLMQIMDGTAIATGSLSGIDIDLRQVARNGHYNVAVGSKIVGDLMQKYNGNVLLMASAYNAGPAKPAEWISRFGDPRTGAIDPVDWIELIPYGETRAYVKKIVSTYVTYLALNGA